MIVSVVEIIGSVVSVFAGVVVEHIGDHAQQPGVGTLQPRPRASQAVRARATEPGGAGAQPTGSLNHRQGDEPVEEGEQEDQAGRSAGQCSQEPGRYA